MNVKSLFSKWLFVVLIIATIFTIGSVNAFAGEGGGNAGTIKAKYTISNYRTAVSPGTGNGNTFYFN